ncbi:magnesium protoporphyrin IX methyltransferase [Candidatus Cyanaurora vandensis]|uniref:magnesium protoporphyrin IX methyltransferase n=1 Tax=Candidatus Cyanaurora vandensis TaxID=2714958 RepID=UPI00257CE6C6|nr:magnesium protoporphyrin IX methyltransferase [Candidatus Cyanaurora vandensis]
MSQDEKAVVREYFNTTGFERWQRIYGEAQVNRVQLAIRRGHQRTLTAILGGLGSVKGLTICDAGCGVGSLSVPLARGGATVFATDISEQMVEEAARRWQQEGAPGDLTFRVQELETLAGSFNIVVCVDVLIHYPLPQAEVMLTHLSQLAKDRLLFTFAPQTPLLSLLKRVGNFFPGAAKATRAYQHPEAQLRELLVRLGWRVDSCTAINEQFYFARLLDCSRQSR